ncbi:MAG: ComEA family DNA-binding protein [Eubacteriales bacterium]
MNLLEKKELKFIIVLLLIIISIYIYKYVDTDFKVLKTQISDNSESIDNETEATDYIWVDIDGSVNKPGVYKILSNSRLYELLELAGGLREDAYTKDLNRSIKLYDEDKIYIKSISEIDQKKESSKININTASKDELVKLNGIGEAISGNILAYREANKFNKIEDIMNVKGIGESKFNGIKENIKVN